MYLHLPRSYDERRYTNDLFFINELSKINVNEEQHQMPPKKEI